MGYCTFDYYRYRYSGLMYSAPAAPRHIKLVLARCIWCPLWVIGPAGTGNIYHAVHRAPGHLHHHLAHLTARAMVIRFNVAFPPLPPAVHLQINFCLLLCPPFTELFFTFLMFGLCVLKFAIDYGQFIYFISTIIIATNCWC